ncbi:MAG: SLBB domain-containing protein [Parachlamydiaceae bacterium]
MSKIQDLSSREWVAVFLLTASFLFLSKSAFQAPDGRWPMDGEKPMNKPASLVVVRVQGSVDKPGAYQFRAGTTIGEVLKVCRVNDTADLTKIDLKQPVKKGQKLTIRSKKKDSSSNKSHTSGNLSHTSPL